MVGEESVWSAGEYSVGCGFEPRIVDAVLPEIDFGNHGVWRRIFSRKARVDGKNSITYTKLERTRICPTVEAFRSPGILYCCARIHDLRHDIFSQQAQDSEE